MVELIGSEKQVQWALEIRTDLREVFEAAKVQFEKWYRDRERWNEKVEKKLKEGSKKIERAVFDNNSAKFYIETFGLSFNPRKVREANRDYFIWQMLQVFLRTL
ncbi:hypothetical protein EHV15_35700 [Paenibacillus oralis]|uniref:Uncharacterized protein n=1 Tax=Paenibacillus oralis TaxID=2490856 RepID=A0A3P3TCT5_9BACL|nr:hypothetical protein [Paenibacillus oralis]RRJ54918.1 hypothetical protein EHV15_35700 [Paenibacillus oralis]